MASPRHTAAVVNLHKQPTVNTLLGRQDFDTDPLREEIYRHCNEEHCYSKNLSEICERRLGSKQFVNVMMLGVAYQLGLIPVSAHSMAWAIKDTIKREHRRNLKAFNIGRKLALEPRVLPRKPQPETWEQLAYQQDAHPPQDPALWPILGDALRNSRPGRAQADERPGRRPEI